MRFAVIHDLIYMNIIRSGKVKDVYAKEDGTLEFHFTNKISVFDKIIPSRIPRKGESLCRTSAHWFKKTEELGIKTHFISAPSPDRMIVKRIDVREDVDQNSMNCLIPLEFIARYYMAGSLWDRVQKGKITPQELGFASIDEMSYGCRLKKPLLEVTTKLEKVDRPVSDEEGMEIAGLTKEEMDRVKNYILKIDAMIEEEVAKRGLIHVDGKKEFAFDENRNIMLIDTFGTGDEDRFWLAKEYEQGQLVEMSKEFIRQYYRESGYHELLMSARENKESEPDIPALPDDLVQKTSVLYADIYEKLTGEAF